MNKVLSTTKFVVDNSKHVSINKDKLREFAQAFQRKHINHWWNVAPFNISKLSDKDKLHFLLIFNSISFCYWGKPKWTVEYKGKKLASGSFGMIAALGRALEENKPVLDAAYLASISKKDFAEILKANVAIPLFDERWKILREVGSVLTNKFDGSFANLVEQSNNDALKLLELIIENFSCFNDISAYKGEKVFFYKRAQLLVSDIYQIFGGKGYGRLKNTNELTACADYKLPQALRKLGIFFYSPGLAKKIDSKIHISKGSEEEVEIRANTIWAVEFIKKEAEKRIPSIESIQINDYLWLIGVGIPPSEKPYHMTITTSY